MSEFKERRSTAFPFPSSPHWAPKTTVTLLLFAILNCLFEHGHSPLTSAGFEFVIEAILLRIVDFENLYDCEGTRHARAETVRQKRCFTCSVASYISISYITDI